VVLEDHHDGFRLRLVPHPGVSERFANGAALCDGMLRPTAAPLLNAREREQLERGTVVHDDAVAELVTVTLPSLRGRVPIDVRVDLPGYRRLEFQHAAGAGDPAPRTLVPED